MERKADHSPKKRFESAIHDQISNNHLTVVSCVYEPLLQSGVHSLVDSYKKRREEKFSSCYLTWEFT